MPERMSRPRLLKRRTITGAISISGAASTFATTGAEDDLDTSDTTHTEQVHLPRGEPHFHLMCTQSLLTK